jgi:hypothetical protein
LDHTEIRSAESITGDYLAAIIAQQYAKIGIKQSPEICRSILNSNLSAETKENWGMFFKDCGW